MLFSLFLFFLVAGAQAQIVEKGPCKEYSTPSNYDPSKILGNWFGYSVIPYYDSVGRCTHSEITFENGSTKIHEQKIEDGSNSFRQIPTLTLDYIGNASYLIKGPENPFVYNRVLTFYNTDYDTYAVKGVCLDFAPSSLQYVWVITRSQHPCRKVVGKIDEALKDLGLPEKAFARINQTDC